MVSLSRLVFSAAPPPLSFEVVRSAFWPGDSLPSSLGLFVLVGLVRGEFAGDAVTGGGREY